MSNSCDPWTFAHLAPLSMGFSRVSSAGTQSSASEQSTCSPSYWVAGERIKKKAPFLRTDKLMYRELERLQELYGKLMERGKAQRSQVTCLESQSYDLVENQFWFHSWNLLARDYFSKLTEQTHKAMTGNVATPG
ncbi:hypothetical protein MG293_001838 [Ovis ammon polii]|uniref:Uncharacterized protein n=1 Tax=Ovis ammon polii TaxID=230172 RepID=A0AAD4YIH2_OVIAM|nr:hypothetical protein MG293_001838 [Ovis ammon polii]